GVDDEYVDQWTVVDCAPPRKPGNETEQREPKDWQSRVESHEQTIRWVRLDVIPPSGKISLRCSAPRCLLLKSRRIRAVCDEQAELEHRLHRLPDVGERLLWADPAERSTQRLGKRLLAGRFTKSVPEECGREIHDKELVVFAVEKKHFVLERGGLDLRISLE